MHIFGDNSQEAFSCRRAQITTINGPQEELAFVLGKDYLAYEVDESSMAGTPRCFAGHNFIYEVITLHINKVFMWTDSSILLQ